MNKVEYSDLYKFMVSAGIALITIAFIAPWLFFREPFDLLVDKTKLDTLTADAKRVVEFRQTAVFWVGMAIITMSVAALFGGIALLVIGLRKWQTVQTVADEQAEANLQKTLSEREKIAKETEKLIKDLTPTEIVAKVEEERKEEIKQEESAVEQPIPQTGVASEAVILEAQRAESRAILDYIELEDMAVDFFAQGLHDAHVLRNKRIGTNVYDAIMQVPNNAPYDIIVNVKILTRIKRPPAISIRSLIMEGFAQAKNYTEALGRRAKTHIIVVVRDEKIVTSTERRIEEALELMAEIREGVSVQVFTETAIRRAVGGQTEATS